MPRTKKYFEKKYNHYDGIKTYLMFNKYMTKHCADPVYFFGEKEMGTFKEMSEEIQDEIIPVQNAPKIGGIYLSDIPLTEAGKKKANEFFGFWNKKYETVYQNVNHSMSDFEKAENFIYNPENGDYIRAVSDNPSLNHLAVSFGMGPTLYKTIKVPSEIQQGKTVSQLELIAEQTAVQLGKNLTDALNEYYASAKELFVLQYARQKAIDDGTFEDTNDQYLADYKEALQRTVNAFEKLVEVHRNNPKEFKPPLQNELSQITGVNFNKVRTHYSTLIEGYKAQIEAADKGWSAEELPIIGFLGETKGEIAFQKRVLANKQEKLSGMEEGPGKEALKLEINALKISIEEFEEEFNDLYTEGLNKEVYTRRDKAEFTKKLADFTKKHRGHCCFFKVGDEDSDIYTLDKVSDQVLDPFGMSGLSRLDQMKDIMDELNEVDGTFQHSSENFRNLRDKLEKLEEFEKKHPGEMTREEMDAYLEIIDEVKAAANKYLDGKKAEKTEYILRHPNEKYEWKEITKKRIRFARELSDRLDVHLETSAGAKWPDASLGSYEYNLALLARRMRAEEKFRKLNLPNPSVDADSGFLNSVYRSLYIESVRSKLLYDFNYDVGDIGMDLTPEKIRTGAKELKAVYRQKGLEKQLISDINHLAELKNKDYGFDFIQSEIEHQMRTLFDAKDESLLEKFGYDNRTEEQNAQMKVHEKTGFGRYLEYQDRDDDGYSKTEDLETKYGIRPVQEKEYTVNVNTVKIADNEKLISEIKDGDLSEKEAGEIIARFMENVHKSDYEIKASYDRLPNYTKENAELKERYFKESVGHIVNSMNLSGMTGKELKEFLKTGYEQGYISEMTRNADAAADSYLVRKNRYAAELEGLRLVDEKLVEKEKNETNEKRKNLISIWRAELKNLYDSMQSAYENPEKEFATGEYLKAKELLSKKIYGEYENRKLLHEENNDLNVISAELNGHVFSAYIEGMLKKFNEQGVLGENHYFLNHEQFRYVKQLDDRLYEAQKNFLKTGVYPAAEILAEVSAFNKRLDEHLKIAATAEKGSDLEIISRYLIPVSEKTKQMEESLLQSKFFNKETIQKAREFFDYVNDANERAAEEKREQEFLKDDRVVNLTTETVLKPENTASATMQAMIKAEESKRREIVNRIAELENENKIGVKNINAIEDIENVNRKDLEKELIASACRTLYMEMLRSRYEDEYKLENMDEEALKKNEASYRKAIVFGFKDKENMVEFANLMREGRFGELFRSEINKIVNDHVNKKEAFNLTHDDIIKARDNALLRDYDEAMPQFKLDEKTGKYVADGEPDFVRADNIRTLAKAFGSEALVHIEDIPFPAPTKEEDIARVRDLQVVTDYNKPEANKAPVKGMGK